MVMTVTENAASSYRVNGKTAQEWWAVWKELAEARAEIRVRCEQASRAWRRANDGVTNDDPAMLWEAFRVVQREYDLMAVRGDIVYALHIMAHYGTDEGLREFLSDL